jgi:iron complex transport system substrate-binding protein
MSCPRLTLLLLVLTCQLRAEDPARRVVSLAPSITQTVRHVRAEDRLVGVTSFCDANEKIVRVQGGILAEPEAVLGLAPDLVLCTTMTPASTRKQMSDLGLRVEMIETPTLGSIREATRRVAALVGTTVPTEEIPRAPANGPSVALLFGAETGYSAGCGSHAHEILQAAGLQNIAAEASGPWPQLGEEFLLRKDPEVLVIADYGESKREDVLAKLRSHPTRRHLRAVQSGKVIVFPAGVFSVPGPEAMAAAPALRTAIDTP